MGLDRLSGQTIMQCRRPRDLQLDRDMLSAQKRQRRVTLGNVFQEWNFLRVVQIKQNEDSLNMTAVIQDSFHL